MPGGLDRATHAKRQPGSTFKPIVYSYALHSHKFTAASLIDPSPDVFEGGYRPTNFEGWQGHDPLRLREAVANSVNVAAVRVLREVGPANVVAWAKALGIDSPMKPDFSVALGSYEVRPIELAGAYATFAAGGVYEEPRVVMRIVGPDGKEVPLPAPSPPHRVMDESEAFLHHERADERHRLRHSDPRSLARSPTRRQDRYDERTQGHVVCRIFSGRRCGDLGRLRRRSMAWKCGTGSRDCTSSVDGLHEGGDGREAPGGISPRPAGIVTATIDKRTGTLPYADDPDVMTEYFLPGTEPTDIASPAPRDAGSAD